MVSLIALAHRAFVFVYSCVLFCIRVYVCSAFVLERRAVRKPPQKHFSVCSQDQVCMGKSCSGTGTNTITNTLKQLIH